MSEDEQVVVNKNKSHRKDKRKYLQYSALRLYWITFFSNNAAWDTDDIDQWASASSSLEEFVLNLIC